MSPAATARKPALTASISAADVPFSAVYAPGVGVVRCAVMAASVVCGDSIRMTIEAGM
jgi:hypothetical protein